MYASLPCPRVRVVVGALGDVSTAGESRDILQGGRPRASQGSHRSARRRLGVPELGTSAMPSRGARRELELMDRRASSIRRPSVLTDLHEVAQLSANGSSMEGRGGTAVR
jgi:hypothetical protein